MRDRDPSADTWKRALGMTSLTCSAAFFAAGVLYSVYYHAVLPPLAFDDAFISFRHVENFLEGHGLVYNRSERVFGSTTPLFVLWLCAIKAIFRDVPLPELAVRANAIFHVLCAFLIALLHHRFLRSPSLALLFGGLFALHPSMLYISASAMEPFLFLALALGTVLTITFGRMRVGAALAGLSVLARPEGAFVLAIWGISWIRHAGARDRVAIMLAAAPALAWAAYATFFYGSPVPHSVVAKLRPIYLNESGWAASMIAERVVRWTTAWSSKLLGPWWQHVALSALLVLGACAGFFVNRRIRELRGWAVPALFACFVGFYVATNPLLFHWYRPLFWVPLFAVLSCGLPALGLGRDATRIDPRDGIRGPRGLPALFTLLALATLAFEPIIANPTLNDALRGKTPADLERTRTRLHVYREAAEWLNEHAHPGASVAAPEIGVLGYYFGGHVYDACGLVSPQALPHLPVPIHERTDGRTGAIGCAFARAVEADYVVTMTTFSKLSIDVDPWFQGHYDVVERLPLPQEIWGSREVLVYERRSSSLRE